jgi:hypothetical protein
MNTITSMDPSQEVTTECTCSRYVSSALLPDIPHKLQIEVPCLSSQTQLCYTLSGYWFIGKMYCLVDDFEVSVG